MITIARWGILLCLVGVVPPAHALAREVPQACTSNLSVTAASSNFYNLPGGQKGVEDTVAISASVTSSCLITQVEASAFGVATALSYNNGPGRWTGTFSIAGQPRGMFNVTVTATDVNGTTASAVVVLVHNVIPVVTITQPTPDSVGLPNITIAAACSDDGGCNMSVSLQGTVILSGASSYNQTVSLAAYPNQIITVHFVATDTNGAQASVDRIVYAQTNSNLVEVFHSPEGVIVNDSASYSLATQPDQYDTFGPGLPILTRKSDGARFVLYQDPFSFSRGYVDEFGAVYRFGGQAWTWRNETVTLLGPQPVVRTAGNYVLWFNGSNNLSRRDMTDGTSVLIGSLSSTGFGYDVASNGEVVYAGFGVPGIYRYRNGTTTKLAAAGTHPVTDGINIAYLNANQIRLYTATGSDILLTDNLPDGSLPNQDFRYAVNNGWTAFLKADGQAVNVFRRAPDGTVTRVSQFADQTVAIGTLNDDGQIVLRHNDHLWLYGLDQQLVDVAYCPNRATLGTVAKFGPGYVNLFVGASVLRLTSSLAIASVTTTAVSAITGSTAASGGNISTDGGVAVTARGVCWATSVNPTTSATCTSDGSGTGGFASTLTGLSLGTTYHVRAYATNGVGTAYGSDVAFTTPTTIPTLTTRGASQITGTTATSGGDISSDGGAAVTVRGVCWATSVNPTTTATCTNDGTGAGGFASAITGLSTGTTYHVRAYAFNSAGIVYGGDVVFTTTATTTPPPTFSDDPITAGTTIKAAHLTELRVAVDALRARYNLSAMVWTDSTIVAGETSIKAVHFVELRTALAEVYNAAGVAAPTYTNTPLVTDVSRLSVTDIAELRSAILAIW